MRHNIKWLALILIIVLIAGCGGGGGGGTSPTPIPSSTDSAFMNLGSGTVVTVAPLNGKYIYTIITAEPSSAREGEAYNTPPSYSVSFSSTAGTTLARIVNSSKRTAKISSMRPAYMRKQAEWDLKVRQMENQLLGSRARQYSKKQLTGINPAPAPPITVGTPWANIYIALTTNSISATCQYISDHAFFFVDDRNTAAMASQLAGYGTAFDAIYDVNHTKFGMEKDIDGNGKVIIIFSQEIAGDYLGYFDANDKYPKSTSPNSNEGDIFYITTTSWGSSIINGALAHEFQHMIYYDEHADRGVTFTWSWLNEALSQAAEYYNGYTTIHDIWMYNFLYQDFDLGLSLTYWTLDNYGYGAIYIRYLIDQYEPSIPDLTKRLCATNLAGIAAVENATGVSFNTIFTNFTRALVMDGTGDSTDPRYQFTSLDLPTFQPNGRGGLDPFLSDTYAAGSGPSESVHPYEIHFYAWTGSFGTMTLSGSNVTGNAFGLSR
jgi:hypothetical protein